MAEPYPLSVDLDGDGIEEIVVPQNQCPGRLAVIFKGPAGYRFQTVNSGFEGTITALGAIPEDGTRPRSSSASRASRTAQHGRRHPDHHDVAE